MATWDFCDISVPSEANDSSRAIGLHERNSILDACESQCDGSNDENACFTPHSTWRAYSSMFYRLQRRQRLGNENWIAIRQFELENEKDYEMWQLTNDEYKQCYEDFVTDNKMVPWVALVLKSTALNRTQSQRNNPKDYNYYMMQLAAALPCIEHQEVLGIVENTTDGVAHVHLMVQTAQRSDNFRRRFVVDLECNSIYNWQTVKVEKVKSLGGLLRYIMKGPILVFGSRSEHLKAQLGILLNDDLQYQRPDDGPLGGRPHKDVMKLIALMEKHEVYTKQDLFCAARIDMLPLMHKGNLNQMIENAALYINTKADPKQLYDRFREKDMAGWETVIDILRYQNLDVLQFCTDFYHWFFHIDNKRNTFVLHGPSNTGKSTFIRPLCSLLKYGEIAQAGEFMFMPCLNKEIVLWEEPLISPDYADKCKLLFEGAVQMINVKHNPQRKLHRVPVFITTNHTLWGKCNKDEVPFKNRIYLYEFNYVHSVHRTDSSTALANSIGSAVNTTELRDSSPYIWTGRSSSSHSQTTGEVRSDQPSSLLRLSTTDTTNSTKCTTIPNVNDSVNLQRLNDNVRTGCSSSKNQHSADTTGLAISYQPTINSNTANGFGTTAESNTSYLNRCSTIDGPFGTHSNRSNDPASSIQSSILTSDTSGVYGSGGHTGSRTITSGSPSDRRLCGTYAQSNTVAPTFGRENSVLLEQIKDYTERPLDRETRLLEPTAKHWEAFISLLIQLHSDAGSNANASALYQQQYE